MSVVSGVLASALALTLDTSRPRMFICKALSKSMHSASGCFNPYSMGSASGNQNINMDPDSQHWWVSWRQIVESSDPSAHLHPLKAFPCKCQSGTVSPFPCGQFDQSSYGLSCFHLARVGYQDRLHDLVCAMYIYFKRSTSSRRVRSCLLLALLEEKANIM